VYPSATLGGVVYLGGALSFIVVGLNASNITAKSGAALYISGTTAVINSSVFANMTATNGPGGAIFFGANSGFALYCTLFIFVVFYLLFFFLSRFYLAFD
jgi:hypothetical protein